MTQRNYQELSPYDFETLVADLLEAEWGGRVETFPQGADEGVDVRLLRGLDGKPKYAQCKHSPGKSWSGIANAVKREAAANAKRDLREYWFVTSARLRKTAKEKIVSQFSDQDLEVARVLGLSDLDRRLDDNPSIERRNIKLYLSSLAVLQAVIHNAAYVKQQQYFDGILERRKLYVESKALPVVQEVLNEHRMCIVSGEPGVGKTTLCEAVALQLMEEGYETFEIKNISEAQEVWRKDAKQLFIYDDFLGQTSLTEKLGHLEDQELEKFAEGLRRSPSHLLLMSTREYILQAASETYPRLSGDSFRLGKVVVDIGSYTPFQKAHILYNHVYFSKLSRRARTSLTSDRRYEKVLAHRNYNPRLIAMIVDEAVAKGGDDAGRHFANFLISGLDNPARLWETILSSELSEVARDSLIILCSLPTVVDQATLLAATRSFRSTDGLTTSTSDFQKALRILEKVFITISRNGSGFRLSLKNPGVRDFVSAYILKDTMTLGRLYSSAIAPDQVRNMFGWALPSPYTGSSPAWRSLTWPQASSVLKLNRKRAADMVNLLESQPVGLTRVYASDDDEFGVQRSDYEGAADVLARAAWDEEDPSHLTHFNERLWPAAIRRWKLQGFGASKIADLFETCWPGFASIDSDGPLKDLVDLIQSSVYTDDLESHVALARIYEIAGKALEAEIERDACGDVIDSEFEALWDIEDGEEISQKVREIDAAIDAAQLSDRWTEERALHEERRPVDGESGHREGSGRVDTGGVHGDTQSIRDLFSTW